MSAHSRGDLSPTKKVRPQIKKTLTSRTQRSGQCGSPSVGHVGSSRNTSTLDHAGDVDTNIGSCSEKKTKYVLCVSNAISPQIKQMVIRWIQKRRRKKRRKYPLYFCHVPILSMPVLSKLIILIVFINMEGYI